MDFGQIHDPHGLHDALLDAFGLEALQAIGAVVAWGHIRAPRAGAELYGEVGIERCGLLRWMQIDHNLLSLDGRFPGVHMGLFHNDGGGMKHLEISAGRFKLLLVHDSDPRTTIPISEYARSLARRNEYWLFQDPNTDLPATLVDNRVYAFLFHAKSDTKGEGPASLEIRFPSGENEYLAEHLRLYKLFPNLMDEAWLLRASLDFAAAVAPKEEKIKEEAMPKLRRASETGTA